MISVIAAIGFISLLVQIVLFFMKLTEDVGDYGAFKSRKELLLWLIPFYHAVLIIKLFISRLKTLPRK